MDNLYIMNGRVRLCDPFLNRTRLWQENQYRQKQQQSGFGAEARLRDVNESSSAEVESRRIAPERQKLWQVQNLYFIGLLAARLLTKRMETDPIKILLDRKIGQSRLKPILKAIFTNTVRLVQQQNHHQIYPFICRVKRALKTRMA
jgi:hypothetical protein